MIWDIRYLHIFLYSALVSLIWRSWYVVPKNATSSCRLRLKIIYYIIKIKHHLPCWRTKEFLCKNIDQKCYMSPWNVTCPEMLTGKNQDCSLKLWQNKCILYALNSVICSPLQDSRLASSRANEVIFAIMHTYVFPSRDRN